MKPKQQSPKLEEKSGNRVFSTGTAAPEDNPFAKLQNLRQSDSNASHATAESSLVKPEKKEEAAVPFNLSKQTATVMRSSKGYGGKTVTLISNLVLSLDNAEKLLHHLKKKMGIGGTVTKEENKLVLMLQGDVRDRVEIELTKLQAKVKRAGG